MKWTFTITDFTAEPASMPVLARTLKRWLPHLDWQGWSPPGAGGPSAVVALRAALDGERADDVRRHAHRLAGASRMVGAIEVTTLGVQLEAAASTAVEDWHGLRSTMRELEAAVARVAVALSRPAVPR